METNVYELCPLHKLEWHVYAINTSTPCKDYLSMDEFVLRSIQQQNLCYVWDSVKTNTCKQLWVFAINSDQDMKILSMDVPATTFGNWHVGHSECLPPDVQSHLFHALALSTARQLVESEHFSIHSIQERSISFTPTQARFVVQSPSLHLLNHYHVSLDESFSLPAITLHFQLILPQYTLCVNVEMSHGVPSSSRKNEIHEINSGWARTLGLLRADDYVMMDVWHMDESLVARVVAGTMYKDVLPVFQSTVRRKKRKDGEGEGGTGEDDGVEEADDEDDEESSRRRGLLGGRNRNKLLKRRPSWTGSQSKSVASVVESAGDGRDGDESSIVPISPDCHVNSPEMMQAPIVCLSLLEEKQRIKRVLQPETTVHIFKRQKKKTKKNDMTLSFVPTSVHSRSSTTLAIPSLPPSTIEKRTSLPGFTTTSDTTQSCPLLDALDQYVIESMKPSQPAECSMRITLPNDPRFSPSDEVKKVLSIKRWKQNVPTQEETMTRLYAMRRWPRVSTIYPRDICRFQRRQRMELIRMTRAHLTIGQVLQYQQAKMVSMYSETSAQQEEINRGIQVMARIGVVPWASSSSSYRSLWKPYADTDMKSLDSWDTQRLIQVFTPHLHTLQKRLEPQGMVCAAPKKKNACANTTRSRNHASQGEEGEEEEEETGGDGSTMGWLLFQDYIGRTTENDTPVPSPALSTSSLSYPQLSMGATPSTVVRVDLSVLSEYHLRGYHPVATPKNVQYCIMCPHSPQEWLATLTLSYLQAFRSLYAQCSLGDHVPVSFECASMTSNTVNLDKAESMLLVHCASDREDVFATYRTAAQVIAPLVNGLFKDKETKSKPIAFAPSPPQQRAVDTIATVIYVVAPFPRGDIRHKVWLLGAIHRGLDTGKFVDLASVHIQLLYLDDLYEVSMDSDPFALLPSCMALYNQISVSVILEPLSSCPSDTNNRKRRVYERLYTVIDWRATESTPPCPLFHLAYTVTTNCQWVVMACMDSTGSMLETQAIQVKDRDITSAFELMMYHTLDCLALFGIPTTIVITRFQCEFDNQLMMNEAQAWAALRASDKLIPSQYAALVRQVVWIQAAAVAKETVQLRSSKENPIASTSIIVSSTSSGEGWLVLQPDHQEAATRRASSRVSCATWLVHKMAHTISETVLLRMQVINIWTNKQDTDGAAAEAISHVLHAVLMDFYALSYLTMHPITLARHCPLPLHMAAVDQLRQDLDILSKQLDLDPLTLRS